MSRKTERKTDTPLAVATLCVRRLTSALRAACPDLREAFREDRSDAHAIAMQVMSQKQRPKRTRVIAEALVIAVPQRNELRDPKWLLRREAAAATQELGVRSQKWLQLVEPIARYHVRRNQKLGQASTVFPAHMIPWLMSVVFGAIAHLTTIIDAQFLNADPRTRGRPPDRVKEDITQILARAKFSTSEICALTEPTNDRAARARVRNRVRESIGKRAEKRQAFSAQARPRRQ